MITPIDSTPSPCHNNSVPSTPPMSTTNDNDAKIYSVLRPVAENHAAPLVNHILNDERFNTLVHDLIADYVDTFCPAIAEDYQHDLALLLLQEITLTTTN